MEESGNQQVTHSLPRTPARVTQTAFQCAGTAVFLLFGTFFGTFYLFSSTFATADAIASTFVMNTAWTFSMFTDGADDTGS